MLSVAVTMGEVEYEVSGEKKVQDVIRILYGLAGLPIGLFGIVFHIISHAGPLPKPA